MVTRTEKSSLQPFVATIRWRNPQEGERLQQNNRKSSVQHEIVFLEFGIPPEDDRRPEITARHLPRIFLRFLKQGFFLRFLGNGREKVHKENKKRRPERTGKRAIIFLRFLQRFFLRFLKKKRTRTRPESQRAPGDTKITEKGPRNETRP